MVVVVVVAEDFIALGVFGGGRSLSSSLSLLSFVGSSSE